MKCKPWGILWIFYPRELSMLEHQTKCAGTVENEYCAVKSVFRFPETVKPVTATKVATKGCGSTYNMVYICQAHEQNKKSWMKMLLVLLMGGFWLALVAYVLWFLFRAKTVQPLTLDDLALTWKVHKKQKGCNASRIHSLIKENDEVIGFRCECGYEFIQKRLISQRSHERMMYPSAIQKQLPNTWKGDCLLF